MEKERCTNCDKILNLKRAIMLECDFRTGEYYLPGDVPEEFSQGGFWFGKDCAERLLKENSR
jgi:hypothetical protein